MKRLLGLLLLLSPALAHAAERARIDLPAGPMGAALATLGRDGVSIRLADPALWQRPVPAVRGRLTIGDALARLVAGSDLAVDRIGPRSWVIRHRPRPPAAVFVPAIATPPEPSSDIVVTASKRSTSLADYAGTAVIVSGADLASPGPPGSEALASRVASVTSTHLGAGRDKLFIRGIADSGLVGQSQATVGQYLGDLRLTYNAPDPSLRLYDIGAIEVLEGPQGTLYGAGSPGGIVRFVRNTPVLDRTEGALSAGVSTTAHGAASGDTAAVLNLPLARDTAGIRLLGYADTAGGYIDTLAGGRNVNRVNTVGGRALLRIVPAEGWTVDVGGVAQQIRGHDAQYADEDLPALTRRSGLDQPYRDDYRLAEVTISRAWDGLRFTSSNAAIRQDVVERYDITGDQAAPLLFRQRNRTWLLASESRLSRPMRNGWSWVVGASLLRNSARLTRGTGSPDGAAASTGVLNRLTEQTGYGELSAEIRQGLTLTGGARLTHVSLTGRALGPGEPLPVESLIAARGSRSQTRVLPSASASVRPGRGWLLYTRYQQGFRPGGLAIGNGTVERFVGDRVGTMEWGLRYDRPGDDAISAAASVAYTRWSDIQADFLDLSGLPVTTNIGDGRIWSAEGRIAIRPIPSLRVEAAVVLNDGRLTRPDIFRIARFTANLAEARASEDLPNVSAIGGRASLDWHGRIGGLDLSAGTWARYIGRTRLGIGSTLGRKEGGYVDTGLLARASRGRYGVSLSAANLLDIAGNRFALGVPLDVLGSREITPLTPRTIRLGFDVSF